MEYCAIILQIFFIFVQYFFHACFKHGFYLVQIWSKCQLVRPIVTEQVIELLRLLKISDKICHSEQYLISKFQHGQFSWIMKYIWYCFVGYKMCQSLWMLGNIVQYWTILAISINIKLILAISNSFLCHLKALLRFYCFKTFCLVTDLIN